MNEIHEANRKGWNAASPGWQAKVDAKKVWHRCPAEPGLVLDSRELDAIEAISGKDACVLGSGDNLVVFALAGLGAHLTSVDISEVQLETAEKRAEELGLDIEFVRADVTDLRGIENDCFDLVYTGGHVAVWVSDLDRYYSEAARILKPGGLFLVNEYHPFRRIWAERPDRLVPEFGYFDRGPHVYDRSEEVPGAAAGSFPSYEFHWTVADHVSAMIDAGCRLVQIGEAGEETKEWESAPLQGLPSSLFIVGQKS